MTAGELTRSVVERFSLEVVPEMLEMSKDAHYLLIVDQPLGFYRCIEMRDFLNALGFSIVVMPLKAVRLFEVEKTIRD